MFYQSIKRKLCGFAAALLSLGISHSAVSLNLSQTPLFLAQPVRPIVMLNMSNDHQLYFKAYDDYTDLDDDGVADTTYMNDYDYYGYFDSGKCYSYESGVFVPQEVTTDHYCDGDIAGDWSGNFLNWATMTRMDSVRKILYGGYRSTDNAYDESDASKDGKTILERAFLPGDAHSFAKYYNGDDVAKLTPFSPPAGLTGTEATGITLCNTTPDSVSSAPAIRVAKGNYSLWASNERWQCQWREDLNENSQDGRNGNDPANSEIYAYPNSPAENDQWVCPNGGWCQDYQKRKVPGAKLGEYTARVQVCVSAELEEDNCRSYPNGNTKPTGLLQQYGDNGDIQFGLMTGSYSRNKSGGVLRKQVGDMTGEVDVNGDGHFIGTSGIVDTLDRLRIYGYSYSDGTYNSGSGDNCNWGKSSFNDGQCTNWGNPQSEIYLESLRYLAGKSASGAFNVGGTDKISGLGAADWNNPISSNNYCAAVSVLQFNASTSSYDADQLSGASDLGITDLDSWTNRVGTAEEIIGNDYFVGESGGGGIGDNNQLCTAKTVGSLSAVRGTCPDAPRLKGSYQIAGLSYYARSEGIQNGVYEVPVRTYGVALSPAVPKITVKVPNSENEVTILPACRNTTLNPDANCAIVDFKIAEQSADGTTGKLYVNWEDSEQGGDFDQDMWGVMDYEVTSSQVKVTTEVMAQSTGDAMGFGYVISGTDEDGFKVHSGVNGFSYGNQAGSFHCFSGGSQGPCDQAYATSATYDIGTSGANLLEQPLYYAAKWGGYADASDGTSPSTEEVAAETNPGTYFYAIEPSQLAEDLSKALEKVIDDVGSASSVSTNSSRLDTNTYIFQALFDSKSWSGEVKALTLDEDGKASGVAWSTDDADTFGATRNIKTYNGSSTVDFSWNTLTAAQKKLLLGLDNNDTITDELAASGAKLVRWIEGEAVSGLRSRDKKLGDVVNSSPVYAGTRNYRFHQLPVELGGGVGLTDAGAVDAYTSYYQGTKSSRSEVLYVAANDGMVHGFDADTGNEVFAYIPSGALDKLKDVATPGYGGDGNEHKYSVDGPLFVGDAYFDDAWHNVLVGTYGAGGKGLFALDVTNPSSPSVLFEVTDDDIGNVIGQPLVAPTGDGWKVILGNGYNSTNAGAKLVLVDLPSGDVQAIDTGVGGTDNGLAGPSLVTNTQRVVTAAYAGDRQGNMWKFDLTANNAGNWGVAYKAGNTPIPLFKAQDAAGTPQPITSPPVVGLNTEVSDIDYMVYFGTGSYLTSADNTANTQTNSIYAVADTGEAVGLTDTNSDGVLDRGSQLMEKVIYAGAEGREIYKDAVTTWWEDKRGWYMDLQDHTISGEGDRASFTPLLSTGERVINKITLKYDRLLYSTLIPSQDPCSYGGSGELMATVAVGYEKYKNYSPFGKTSIHLSHAVIGEWVYISKGEDGGSYYNDDAAGDPLDQPTDIPDGVLGRMSWRQLR